MHFIKKTPFFPDDWQKVMKRFLVGNGNEISSRSIIVYVETDEIVGKKGCCYDDDDGDDCGQVVRFWKNNTDDIDYKGGGGRIHGGDIGATIRV